MNFKMMYSLNIIILGLLIFNPSLVNAEYSYLRFRNSFLRIYIASDKNRISLINDYTVKIYQKIKYKITKKYYDLNLFYNNLSDEEKELIEFIISLYY